MTYFYLILFALNKLLEVHHYCGSSIYFCSQFINLVFVSGYAMQGSEICELLLGYYNAAIVILAFYYRKVKKPLLWKENFILLESSFLLSFYKGLPDQASSDAIGLAFR